MKDDLRIGDSGAYLTADVVCDRRDVSLSGARGSAPTTTYRETATSVVGHRALTTAMFAGVGAAGKARRMAEALITRTERLLVGSGFEPLAESSNEVVGAGDVLGRERDDTATEVVVKIGVRHPPSTSPRSSVTTGSSTPPTPATRSARPSRPR